MLYIAMAEAQCVDTTAGRGLADRIRQAGSQ
jgi:hypothetical protein